MEAWLEQVRGALDVLNDSTTLRLLASLPGEGNPKAVEQAAEWLWEMLHSWQWKQVPLVYRELYAWLALLRSTTLSANPSKLREALALADKGILLGAPCLHQAALVDLAQCLHKTVVASDAARGDDDDAQQQQQQQQQQERSIPAARLHSEMEQGESTPAGLQQPKRPRTASTAAPLLQLLPPHSLSPHTAIPRADRLSLSDFSQRFFRPRTPVIIKGMLEPWPALQLWRDEAYLRRVMGHRLVPVETGRSYLDAGAGQRLMTVNAFLDCCSRVAGGEGEGAGGGGGGACVYLAQHQLVEQVPALAKDFSIPDYTALSDDDDDDDEEEEEDENGVVVQCWLGPPCTLTPLHFDTSHNLLAQVAGHKYVRLYAPDQTPRLYPMDGAMRNNSKVDLLLQLHAPDDSSFPLAREAVFCDAVLAPGDLLFVPRGWWHFVQGVSVEGGGGGGGHCFSVSFWWEKRELAP